MLLNKGFDKSCYEISSFLRIKYYQVLTRFWIGFFLKRNGKKNCIINPILLTPKWINIDNNVFIRDGGRIEGVSKHQGVSYTPNIILHDYVSIEQNVHITCANKIEIGKNTAIAANVTITDIDHPYQDILLSPEKQPLTVKFVEIGEDCKIYNNVVILPGSYIGKHSVVAANSVVMGKVYPDYCILAGAPARIVKRYNLKTNNWDKTNIKGDFI